MKKGFTLIELMAVIAVMAVLAMFVLPNVIDLFSGSVDKVMKAQEAEAVDAAKLYLQDYCIHPINNTYKNDCNSNFKNISIDGKKKYLCVNTLQEKEYFEEVLYKDVPCKGIVVLSQNENEIYDSGQTYLFCGENGNYDYETEGGEEYKSYLNSCS